MLGRISSFFSKLINLAKVFFLKSKKCTDYVNVKNKQKYLRIIDMSIKNCSQNKKNEKRIESKGGERNLYRQQRKHISQVLLKPKLSTTHSKYTKTVTQKLTYSHIVHF